MSDHTGVLNVSLEDHIRFRKEARRLNPDIIFPWRRPCSVSVLLLTDGDLNFGLGDFGLSAFVNLLSNGRSYVRFNLTLGHLRSNVTDAEVMKGAPGIAASIKDFRFDNPQHFTATKYDEVWMFGFETNFHQPSYNHRNTNRPSYPSNRLSDAELVVLNAHMQRGGGVFATGDHGALGRALCGSVNRVRSMRYWNSHVVAGQDEVGMTNARRNDTNQRGDAGTQFSDQSDDLPQTIDLKLYSARLSIFTRERYPHPLLCGPKGRIDVLPDHPHEGECVEPSSLTAVFAPDGTEEYPAATGGGPRVSPEVIATSHVPAGNTATLRSSFKTPTVAHSFGCISAYDGHRAGVGRVACDSTWHHFVNVNLIGVVEGEGFDDLTPADSPTKHDGFMSTTADPDVLAKIKDYFINIGVWIAPPARHTCFRKKLSWEVIFRARLMEAALVDPDVDIGRIPLDVLHHIGSAARDVVGGLAGQCRSLEFVFDVFRPLVPELVELVDPWPLPDPPPDPPPFPWLDPLKLLETALGAAVVSLRQRFPYPPAEFDEAVEREADKAILDGARHGLQRGMRQMAKDMDSFNKVFRASAQTAQVRLD